jgi:predicted RNase H-like HicB family nuclease
MIGIEKKWHAEIARLYGKNKSSFREVMKIKEKIRDNFYIAQQNAKFTAKTPDKYLMNLEKALNFWVENIHTKRLPVDDNLLKQIALSLYESFHKEDGTEEENKPSYSR